MIELRNYLDRLGYAEFCACFNPMRPRIESWEKTARCIIDRSLLAFLDLLLLGRAVSRERFTEDEHALLQPLIESGLVESRSHLLQTRGLVLYVVLGFWMFFERPAVDISMYYGDDSFALLNRIRPVRGGHSLDLCAGPGAQSIQCSRSAALVTSVEVNPFSAALAFANKEINEIENWQILTGSLFEPVPPGATFDHIVCNPPLLPFPEDMQYPFVGHGGSDGWKFIWEILDRLPECLAPHGRAQLIGATLSDGIIPATVDRLADWARQAGMDCRLFVVAHNSLNADSGYFSGLSFTSSVVANRSILETQGRFQKFLREASATHLATHYLCVTHGVGKLFVNDLDLDQSPSKELWFV
jgi:release factor glutamine methyltransferase